MSKKYYRYFCGLLNRQEAWINKKASQGYRLIGVHTLSYEFEKCGSNNYHYCVDFIADKGRREVEDYKLFLEDLGFVVFYKNMNLNYSAGKIRIRPWAKEGGKIATKNTTYNKEVLIAEITPAYKAYKLHTSSNDMIAYYKNIRKPWECLFLLLCLFAIINLSLVWILPILFTLIPICLYQMKIHGEKREARIHEE